MGPEVRSHVLLLLAATAVRVPVPAEGVGRASLLESVLTIGGFLLVILLLVSVQLWSQRRRRRGDEAGTHDARGAEVMLGPWIT